MKRETAKPIHVPRSHAKQYERDIREHILKPIIAYNMDVIRRAGFSARAIQNALVFTPFDSALVGMATVQASKFIAKLEKYHKYRFERTMRAAFGVRDLPFAGDLEYQTLLNKSLNTNVDLIKTIPKRYHADLKNELSKISIDTPFDERAIAQSTAGVGKSAGYNLRRITRDQTSKLIGQLNEARQTNLGISEYIWQTSQDEAVRPTHVANNGMRVRWDQPPADTGHPGNDIQCRCVALAVIP